MKVASIEIKNILGIKHLEFKPGAGLTVINGANATGKSSVEEAIKSVFQGGHDATLIHKGAESGQVVIVLDDGMKIERTVTPTRSATMVTHPEFGQIKKPAAFLEQLIDKLGMNPIDFLAAPAKVRTQLLLEAMPIKLDSALIEPIIGHKVDPLDTDALELIARERQRFYDDRTGVNRVAKEKRATVEQMKQTLPEGDEDTDWNRVVKTLDDQLSKERMMLVGFLDAEMDLIADKKNALTAARYKKEDEIKGRLEAEIDNLRKAADVEIANNFSESSAKREAIEKEGYANLERIQAEKTPEIERLAQKLGIAEQNQGTQSKVAQTRQYVKELSEQAALAEAQSETDTKKIEALDKLKTSLLESLPIKGVEIKDGQVFIDSIPFDRVNEARKVDVAIQIAQLRSGKLPLIIVDGLERLDSKTFAAFKKAAEKSKVQMIVTRVSDSALAVEA